MLTCCKMSNHFKRSIFSKQVCAGVFKVVTLIEDFRKGEFLWAENTGLVWTKEQNKEGEMFF